MKTIGLIGGMSWESTADYYRIINQEVNRRLGRLHSARCVLYSVDFDEIERLQTQGEWEQMGGILAEAACRLEAAGAELIVLCTNTMHKVADQIQAATRLPLLHIADLTAARVLAEGVTTAGLLGTKYTMEQDFYISRLQQRGIQVLTPSAPDRALVNAVIFDELCLGQVRDDSRAEYRRIIAGLVAQGAQGVILGCTEIGALVKPADSPVPLFDTTLLHALGAVDWALG